jgi:hypothetical protein
MILRFALSHQKTFRDRETKVEGRKKRKRGLNENKESIK